MSNTDDRIVSAYLVDPEHKLPIPGSSRFFSADDAGEKIDTWDQFWRNLLRDGSLKLGTRPAADAPADAQSADAQAATTVDATTASAAAPAATATAASTPTATTSKATTASTSKTA